jgi:N-acetylglucosaminyldiphosphoundecaprenol N-acetyl-beta-D-mannosaminyltransferase
MASQTDPKKFTRYSLLGLPINALSKDDLVELVAEAVRSQKRYVIGHHNLHGLYVVQHDSRMRAFYSQADFVHADGMSLVAIGRLLGIPLSREMRTGYVDLLPVLLRRAVTENWRVFYIGSKPGIADKGAEILRSQYPNLQIQVRNGYFNSDVNSPENLAVLDEIERYQPHVLMVGMGMPKQESWILENLPRIRANTVFCCGALIDYVADEIPTPPRWLGQIGLEWLYRLYAEPSRLWYRYLVEPWTIAGVVIREIIRPPRRNPAEAGGNGPSN